MTEGQTTGCLEAILAGIAAAKDDNSLDAIHALVARMPRFTREEADKLASAFELRQGDLVQVAMRRRVEARSKFCEMLTTKVAGLAAAA